MAVFAACGTPKVGPKEFEVIKACLPPDICQNVKYFPLPGAYNYAKLDFKDKFLMNLGPRIVLRRKAWFGGDPKAKEQLAVFCKEQDWTTRDAIAPVVECTKA